MREETIINQFGEHARQIKQIVQYIGQLEQSVRLAFTGETVRAEALQKLLLDKGIFTQEELTKAVGDTIQKMQAEGEERAKAAAAAITVPTPEQVQQVTETKGEAEVPAAAPAVVPEVAPPQA